MPPRTTDRNITTCRNCRRRKIRCDRGRPRCNRCRENGAACVYEDQIPRRARRYHFVTETPGNALREAFEPSGSFSEPATVPIPAERLQSIETHVENLVQMVRTIQASSRRSSTRSTGQPSSSTLVEPLSRTSTGQSHEQAEADLRFVDLAFLTSMCDEVTELSTLLSSQARYLLSSGQESPADEGTQSEAEVEPAQYSEASLDPAFRQLQQDIPVSFAEPLTSGSFAMSTAPPEPIAGMVMSPPNIDWTMFDQILNGNLDVGGQRLQPEQSEVAEDAGRQFAWRNDFDGATR